MNPLDFALVADENIALRTSFSLEALDTLRTDHDSEPSARHGPVGGRIASEQAAQPGPETDKRVRLSAGSPTRLPRWGAFPGRSA